MDAEKTGKLIKELRTEKGLTQQELASRLKVSSTAVSKWENGKNLPDISLLEPLAETLGVSIYDIVKGKSPAQKEETEMAAETESEKGSADTAIKSVIGAAIDQRKKRTRRSIRILLVLCLLWLRILPAMVSGMTAQSPHCAMRSLQTGKRNRQTIYMYMRPRHRKICRNRCWSVTAPQRNSRHFFLCTRPSIRSTAEKVRIRILFI